MAAWDELREKSRTEGDVVALGDTYRKTLDRHAALLKQAEPFRARPKAFASLLAERARIGRGDLEEFEALHDRARRHRRTVTMRQVHRTRRESERQVCPADTREDVRPADGEAVEAAREARKNPVPPVPEPPDWLSAWEPVIGEWNALIDRAGSRARSPSTPKVTPG